MLEKEKWEARSIGIGYNLHKGYTIHNETVRRHGRYQDVVYNVDGKELTLKQIWERENESSDQQLQLL